MSVCIQTLNSSNIRRRKPKNKTCPSGIIKHMTNVDGQENFISANLADECLNISDDGLFQNEAPEVSIILDDIYTYDFEAVNYSGDFISPDVGEHGDESNDESNSCFRVTNSSFSNRHTKHFDRSDDESSDESSDGLVSPQEPDEFEPDVCNIKENICLRPRISLNDVVNIENVFKKSLVIKCEKLDIDEFCKNNNCMKHDSYSILFPSVCDKSDSIENSQSCTITNNCIPTENLPNEFNKKDTSSSFFSEIDTLSVQKILAGISPNYNFIISSNSINNDLEKYSCKVSDSSSDVSSQCNTLTNFQPPSVEPVHSEVPKLSVSSVPIITSTCSDVSHSLNNFEYNSGQHAATTIASTSDTSTVNTISDLNKDDTSSVQNVLHNNLVENTANVLCNMVKGMSGEEVSKLLHQIVLAEYENTVETAVNTESVATDAYNDSGSASHNSIIDDSKTIFPANNDKLINETVHQSPSDSTCEDNSALASSVVSDSDTHYIDNDLSNNDDVDVEQIDVYSSSQLISSSIKKEIESLMQSAKTKPLAEFSSHCRGTLSIKKELNSSKCVSHSSRYNRPKSKFLPLQSSFVSDNDYSVGCARYNAELDLLFGSSTDDLSIFMSEDTESVNDVQHSLDIKAEKSEEIVVDNISTAEQSVSLPVCVKSDDSSKNSLLFDIKKKSSISSKKSKRNVKKLKSECIQTNEITVKEAVVSFCDPEIVSSNKSIATSPSVFDSKSKVNDEHPNGNSNSDFYKDDSNSNTLASENDTKNRVLLLQKKVKEKTLKILSKSTNIMFDKKHVKKNKEKMPKPSFTECISGYSNSCDTDSAKISLCKDDSTSAENVNVCLKKYKKRIKLKKYKKKHKSNSDENINKSVLHSRCETESEQDIKKEFDSESFTLKDSEDTAYRCTKLLAKAMESVSKVISNSNLHSLNTAEVPQNNDGNIADVASSISDINPDVPEKADNSYEDDGIENMDAEMQTQSSESQCSALQDKEFCKTKEASEQNQADAGDKLVSDIDIESVSADRDVFANSKQGGLNSCNKLSDCKSFVDDKFNDSNNNEVGTFASESDADDKNVSLCDMHLNQDSHSDHELEENKVQLMSCNENSDVCNAVKDAPEFQNSNEVVEKTKAVESSKCESSDKKVEMELSNIDKEVTEVMVDEEQNVKNSNSRLIFDTEKSKEEKLNLHADDQNSNVVSDLEKLDEVVKLNLSVSNSDLSLISNNDKSDDEEVKLDLTINNSNSSLILCREKLDVSVEAKMNASVNNSNSTVSSDVEITNSNKELKLNVSVNDPDSSKVSDIGKAKEVDEKQIDVVCISDSENESKNPDKDHTREISECLQNILYKSNKLVNIKENATDINSTIQDSIEKDNLSNISVTPGKSSKKKVSKRKSVKKLCISVVKDATNSTESGESQQWTVSEVKDVQNSEDDSLVSSSRKSEASNKVSKASENADRISEVVLPEKALKKSSPKHEKEESMKSPQKTPRNRGKKPSSPVPTEGKSVPLTSVSNKEKVKKESYSPEAVIKPLKFGKKPSSPVSAEDKSVSLSPAPDKGKMKPKSYSSEGVIKPFKFGWMREVVHRAVVDKSKSKSDIYYFTPEGTKLRSMPEIGKYLTDHKNCNLTLENFTFAKETIYREPFETERSAKVKSTAISDSPVISNSSKSETKEKTVKRKAESVTVEESPVKRTSNRRQKVSLEKNELSSTDESIEAEVKEIKSKKSHVKEVEITEIKSKKNSVKESCSTPEPSVVKNTHKSIEKDTRRTKSTPRRSISKLKTSSESGATPPPSKKARVKFTFTKEVEDCFPVA